MRAVASLAVTALIVDLGEVTLPLRAAELFGAPVPLEVELGAGQGRFLAGWAAANPRSAFIGVERSRKYLLMAATRAARYGLSNVRFLHTTVEDLLFRCLAPASVAAIHVYFPDPWPKARHHKRRIFKPSNLERLVEVLAPGGVLRAKTDHDGYSAVIADLVAGEPRLAPLPADQAFAGIPGSTYEEKAERESRPVYRFAYRRG